VAQAGSATLWSGEDFADRRFRRVEDGGICAVDGEDQLARGWVESGRAVETGLQHRTAAVGGDDEAEVAG
jgi:hypothetical protein